MLDLADPEHPTEPAWPDGHSDHRQSALSRRQAAALEPRQRVRGALFRVYEGRVPARPTWSVLAREGARRLVEAGECERVGLLATQGIRGGANRRILERIKESGDIFLAWGG